MKAISPTETEISAASASSLRSPSTVKVKREHDLLIETGGGNIPTGIGETSNSDEVEAEEEDDEDAKNLNPDLLDDEDGSDTDRKGRRKICIEYIKDKSRRHITFSKRKAGILKKAYELSTLTGTQVLLLVVSETGVVYTFTTPKLKPILTENEGKDLIQRCLYPSAEEYTDRPVDQDNLQNGSTAERNIRPLKKRKSAQALKVSAAAARQQLQEQQQQHPMPSNIPIQIPASYTSRPMMPNDLFPTQQIFPGSPHALSYPTSPADFYPQQHNLAQEQDSQNLQHHAQQTHHQQHNQHPSLTPQQFSQTHSLQQLHKDQPATHASISQTHQLSNFEPNYGIPMNGPQHSGEFVGVGEAV